MGRIDFSQSGLLHFAWSDISSCIVCLSKLYRGMRVWIGLLCLVVGQSVVHAQTNGLAVKVANNTEDLRIVNETIRSLRLEVEDIRRENARLHERERAFETRIENSLDRLATVEEVNHAIAEARKSLEERDERLKMEIIEKVTKQVADFAESVAETLAQLSGTSLLSERDIRTSFPRNFPEDGGDTHVVQSGESLSAIAAKYGSTVDWIQNANGIPDASLVRAGRKLYIPMEQ